jgi:hypothetical protein
MNMFSKGLVLDVDPIKQPENTYRYAQNAILNTNSEDMYELSSEYGNRLCAEIPVGYTVVGKYVHNDDTIILFSTDGTDSEIGKVVDCTYTTLINDACLNFSEQFPIVATGKTINGCELAIIFVDFNNDDKYINLDRLTDYQTGGNWDCNLMKIHPNYTVPAIGEITVNNSGGVNVELGTYSFSFRYLDRSGQPISDWTSPTLPIPVIDGDPDQNNSDGGYNISAGYLPENGAKLATNKSISIPLTNIDTSFDKVEVSVIKKTNGDNVTVRTFKLGSFDITGSTYTYLYTGDETAIEITLNEILTPLAKYKKSKFVNQLDGRLIRYNVKEEVRDWARFQQEALKIEARWVANEMKLKDQKRASFYLDSRSFMADEVYAIGIVWLFKDGTESPVFHIPGRKKDKYADGTDIPDSLADTPHSRPAPNVKWDSTTILDTDPDNFTDGPSERWKIYNTAINDGNTSGVDYSGELGYYEVDAEYPDIDVCNGRKLYSTYNGAGTLIEHFAGQKIRHHRMPDATMLKAGGNIDVINVRGLAFNNIVPPTEYVDQVVGYKIVRGIRTEENKTILDKGIYYGMNHYLQKDSGGSIEADFYFQRPRFNGKSKDVLPDTGGLFSTFLGNWVPLGTGSEDLFRSSADDNIVSFNTDYLAFHTVRNKVDNYFPNCDYVRVETTTSGSIHDTNESTSKAFEDLGSNSNKVLMHWVDYEVDGIPSLTNRTVDVLGSLGFNSRLEVDSNIFINNTQQEYLLVKNNITDPLPVTDDSDEGAGTDKNVGDIYELGNTVHISMKRNADVFDKLQEIQYVDCTSNHIPLGVTSTVVFGGDTFISKMTFRTSLDAVRESGSARNFGFIRGIVHVFLESQYNLELRHEGTGINGHKYHPKSYSDNAKFMFMEQWQIQEDLDTKEPYVVYPNHYGYNKDYSSEPIKTRYPLPHTYDWETNVCDECAGGFVNRFAYSEETINYEQGDSYRTFLANNFVDLPANTGEIVSAFSIQNNLYVKTPFTVYRYTINPRELQVTGETVSIGTGTFLSLKPIQLSLSNQGGTLTRFTDTYSPYGVIYVDNKGETIYEFQDALKPISRAGIHSFCRNNIDYTYSADNKDYLHQKFTSAYDPYSDRYVIAKRDYRPLFEYSTSEPYVEGEYYYINGVFYQYSSSTLVELNLTDATRFADESWTVSYSPLNNAWVSFHSYKPDWLLNTSTDLYSIQGNALWIHDIQSDWHEYMGSKFSHIIEYTESQLNSVLYDTIWSGYFELDGEQVNDKFFNKIWVYNRDQSSDKLDLTFSSNPYYQTVGSNPSVQKEESFYTINNFRSIASATPVSTDNWSQSEYRAQYVVDNYIDKVPRTLAHTSNMSLYEREMFRKNYANIRLFFLMKLKTLK